MMEKRGQITAFIIVGIVLLIVVALVLFARNFLGIGIAPQKFLSMNMEPIKGEVSDCVVEVVPAGVELMGLQGGDLNPIKYRLYKGNKVRYLCQNIPDDDRCLNSLPPLSDWEEELSDYLKFEMKECVDLEGLKKPFAAYELEDAEMELDVSLMSNKVLVEIDYPVTLSNDGVSVELPRVVKAVDIPLGGLYMDVYAIVEGHAMDGEFYHLPYMLSEKGAVEIRADKPYPDVIYILNKKNSDYIFQFAIEGEEERTIW